MEIPIAQIRVSREMAERYMYMMLEEYLDEYRQKGVQEVLAEAVISLLKLKGDIPELLQIQINEQKNVDLLKEWLKNAATVQSVEEFEKIVEKENPVKE